MIGTENNGMYMPVAPAYMGGNCNGGFGNGDWGGWLILFLIFGLFNGNGGWGGNSFGGGNGLYPWLNNSNQLNDGFRDQMMNSTINGIQNDITSGFGNMQTALCSGLAGVNASINGAQNAISAQMYGNQIADMNQRFTDTLALNNQINVLASSLQNCCCENRSNIAELKYTVATENCSDRQAISNGIRDLLAANTASTQRILDQLCQDKIDAKNDTIAQLRSELLYARGQASQDVQTGVIQAGQRALANEIEQYVLPTPRPAYIVQNPNCCMQNYGCGCGVA